MTMHNPHDFEALKSNYTRHYQQAKSTSSVKGLLGSIREYISRLIPGFLPNPIQQQEQPLKERTAQMLERDRVDQEFEDLKEYVYALAVEWYNFSGEMGSLFGKMDILMKAYRKDVPRLVPTLWQRYPPLETFDRTVLQPQLQTLLPVADAQKRFDLIIDLYYALYNDLETERVFLQKNTATLNSAARSIAYRTSWISFFERAGQIVAKANLDMINSPDI